MDLIDNPNLIPLIGNNPIKVPNTNINRIAGPSVIPTIERPVVRGVESPVVRGLEVPIIDAPNTRIPYPVVNVPTQQEFDAAVKAEKEKQAAEKEEKSRGLPDPKPAELPPAIQQAIPQAVVTTAATMAATTVFNTLKNAAEPLIKEATKKKFKLKIKQVKPVLHYVLAEGGHIDVFEYSAEGTRLVDQVDNVEQYIRDQVEINSLYEIDNKIIIDDVISEKFTKEGQKRFKPLFAPAKKIAKKLSAKFSI